MQCDYSNISHLIRKHEDNRQKKNQSKKSVFIFTQLF